MLYTLGTKGSAVNKDKVKVTFLSSVELHQAAKDKAAAQDMSLSQVFRWLIGAWVRGNIAARPPGPEQEAGP